MSAERQIADPLVADLHRVLLIVRDAFAEPKADTPAEHNATQNAYRATCWAIEQIDARAARVLPDRCGVGGFGWLCLQEVPCPKHSGASR